MPISKQYLRAATTPDTGTLPGATNVAGQTINTTATGATTNRDMTDAPGTSQTSLTLNTQASTGSQNSWFGRWVSRPIAAQTIPGSTNWLLDVAGSEANAASNLGFVWRASIWRPGTGAVVVAGFASSTTTAEPGTTQTAALTSTGTSSAQTAQSGDILVLEVFSLSQVQSMATSYANTLFYDGTTEDSITSVAAYFSTPGIWLQGELPEQRRSARYQQGRQAVKRAATWYRRGSGVWVPGPHTVVA